VEEAIAAVHLKETILVLAIAGVAVPFMLYHWGVSPVLGYLGMGVLLGPHGLGHLAKGVPLLSIITIEEARVADITGVATFGVVFLLFLIGIELSLQRLATMRAWVFGIGGAQVILSTSLLASLFVYFADFKPIAALIVGASLALSSTAIVIEVLTRSKRTASTTGRLLVSVLLLQDLAVVPILLLLNTLAGKGEQSVTLGLCIAFFQAVCAIACIFAVGRLVMKPLFRTVTATGIPELFMATTLLVIIVASVATAFAGLSMALGAFMAGLLLAETKYSRAVETIINPFKGLLLGVFFFSVGMQVELAVLIKHPVLIPTLAITLSFIKGLVMFCIARLAGINKASAIEGAFLIAPGGEFAFIILGIATSLSLLSGEIGDISLTVVSVTMVFLPLMAKLGRRIADNIRGIPSSDEDVLIPSGG